MESVASFFTLLVDVLLSLLLTDGVATITPLQTLMWAGLILGFLVFVIGVVKRLASQG